MAACKKLLISASRGHFRLTTRNLQYKFIRQFSSTRCSQEDFIKERGFQQLYDAVKCYRQNGKKDEHVLICGDGDLSYAASIARDFAEKDIKLVASVLESKSDHSKVYRNSKLNVGKIEKFGHQVRYSIDATKLTDAFESAQFDRIQFNFPHWRGKTNHKYNRRLISNFLESSSHVLSKIGQVHMALMSHQGAAYVNTLNHWKDSWMPARYAANNNLLLTDVIPFSPQYDLSSYKWRDRSFRSKRGDPFMYIFTNPDGNVKAPLDLQLYSHFNIFIRLPTKDVDNDDVNIREIRTEDLLNVNIMKQFVQERAPSGIRTDAWFLKTIEGSLFRDPVPFDFAEYQIALFGESVPMTKLLAQEFIETLETDISCITNWKKTGQRYASHVRPSSLFTSFKSQKY